MEVAKKECVSIIVPAYEAGNYLAECLESQINQTYANVEIIIVYKKSSDNTETVLDRYKDRVKIVEQRGKSPANARNLGIAQCKGKYVAFCDADDLFHVEKTEKQVAFVKERDVDLVYSDYYLMDRNGNVFDKVKTPDWDFETWLRSYYIAFSTVMIKRDLLVKAHCFDERWSASEDFDLLIRLSKFTDFRRLPESLTCRRIHKNNLTRSVLKTLLSRSGIYYSHGFTCLAISSFMRGMMSLYLVYFVMDHPSLYALAKRLLRNRRE